ncbi:hypothetical protein HY485_00815 [Candidatus Woesearchaeota archaeon]|nr:hypothetical protein [Candidatus Woesearchaeota archaeon]
MNNRTTTIIALLTSITGIAMLAFFLPYDAEKKMTAITGTVVDIEHKEKFDIIKIMPTKPITVLSFEKTNTHIEENTTIYGRLQDYNGKIELVASRMT